MVSMSFSTQFAFVRPAYQIPEQDLVGEVLIPAMRSCDQLRIEAGFFSSRCLAQIAPGLASFVNDTTATLHLMVSPQISGEDQEAIRRGVRDPETVLVETMSSLFENARLSKSAIERHAVDTLAFLVASGRMQLRVVLMDRGMYHRKIWLFGSGDKWLAVHGSGNATERGLLVNGEQMSIERAWVDGEQSKARVRTFLEQWDKRWNNQLSASLTIEVEHCLNILRRHSGPNAPTVSDFWDSWRIDNAAGLEPKLPAGHSFEPLDQRLKIPASLEWRAGRFAHQEPAVNAILERGGGILSIATGGGKTKTALIASTDIQQQKQTHTCVVILTPSNPLIKQWAKDVREFNVDPVILSGISPAKRVEELERITIAFGTTKPRTEVLLLTNSLFAQPDSVVRHWIDGLPDSVIRILIADEVHNLGAPSFIRNQPEFFEHRIGLSATPIRQFDPDGTDQLFEFFGGPPVFEFTLRDAIKSGCLVPYRYYPHIVELNTSEMENYEDLTEQLARAGFRVDDDGRTIGLTHKVERLLRDRRALIEQADSKLEALEQALREINPKLVKKTLIYTSAKPSVMGKPKQITMVNRLLQNLHITSHQFTASETGKSGSQLYLDGLGRGYYQVLTAMKVLDEGIDIPQIDTAFLLASSTVEREWVQRRGRILRNAPGKRFGHLHDFIVIAPDSVSSAGVSLLRTELRRASAFADLAENEFDPDGPSSTIRQLESRLRTV